MLFRSDGPTTLTHLRQSRKTADIPVVFMTARAQPRELEHFVSLGAEGVIAKPFDPMTLAAAVRNYIGGLAAGIAARRASFLERTREYGKVLAGHRTALADPMRAKAALEGIRNIAHSIAGGGGIFGLVVLSREAAELETAAIVGLDGDEPAVDVDPLLDLLIGRIERM